MVSLAKEINIRLYCGIGEQTWNGIQPAPGKYACVAPVYGNTETNRKENRVFIPEGTSVIQDSGAFSDGPTNRLTKEQALARQILHAYKWKYADKISHVASYDVLIDERWENGKRSKERWTEDLATYAVEETISAAKWLSENRSWIPYTQNLVLGAQGVTPLQYLYCAEQIVPHFKFNDVFGFGGFCIVGKMRRRMMPIFAETVKLVMPLINEAGIKQVHLWGVLLDEALAQIGYWCNKYNIKLSTDSVGPSVRPCFGSWGYSDWRDNTYCRPDTDTRGLERKRHVEETIKWLHKFDINKYLHSMYEEYLE